jgi:hypothetical protein
MTIDIARIETIESKIRMALGLFEIKSPIMVIDLKYLPYGNIEPLTTT